MPTCVNKSDGRESMITKMHYAHRVPISRLNDFIDFARRYMMKKAATYIAKIAMPISLQTINPILDCLTDNYYGKGFCDTICDTIDCGLNIWIQGRCAYIMPIASNLTRYQKAPSYAKFYGYWNNTDAPVGTSTKEWNQRRDKWDEICTGEGAASHNAHRLYYTVIETKTKANIIASLYAIIGELGEKK
jgi:hypothetical protein